MGAAGGSGCGPLPATGRYAFILLIISDLCKQSEGWLGLAVGEYLVDMYLVYNKRLMKEEWGLAEDRLRSGWRMVGCKSTLLFRHCPQTGHFDTAKLHYIS
jgi:hypothetical protein